MRKQNGKVFTENGSRFTRRHCGGPKSVKMENNLYPHSGGLGNKTVEMEEARSQ